MKPTNKSVSSVWFIFFGICGTWHCRRNAA